MRIRAVPIVLIILVMITSGWTFGKKPQKPSLEQLRQAPEQITIGGTELVLETYLWRDFMPMSPPGGRPLQGVVKLRNPQGKPLPSGLQITRVWVLRDQEVWETVPEHDTPGSTATQLERSLRNGPGWEPGKEVTVVAEVQDATGKTYLLRADRQVIQRTM